MKKSGKQDGFSLLEVVIVIGVMMILSGSLLGYNRTSERQLALYASQAELVGFLNRAKAAALEKREKGLEGKTICAFGVHLELKSTSPMILFADLPADPTLSCAANNFNKAYDAGLGEKVEDLAIDQRVEITEFRQQGNPVTGPVDIVFEPPYLKTYIKGIANSEGMAKLKIKSQNVFACVTIGAGGAIFASNCP